MGAVTETRVLKAGDIVDHPGYGRGRVLRIVSGGEYFVNFFLNNNNQYCTASELRWYRPDGRLIPVSLPARRMSRHGSPDSFTGQIKGAAGLPEGEEGEFVALRVLEAMRTGVVGERVELYTVGRLKEMALIDEELKTIDNGAVRVFLGDYGAGKTHMLECLEAKALRSGCLTARTALNSKDISPSNPSRVYKSLMLNLVYPDHSGKEGLAPLFVAAYKRGLTKEWQKKENFHAYISRVLHFFDVFMSNLEARASGDESISAELLNAQEKAVRHLLDWLEGQNPKQVTKELNLSVMKAFPGTSMRYYTLPALKDFRTFSHIYCYIWSGLAALARQVGYKGLALLLDEAEMYNILDVRNRRFADTMFAYYSLLALGPESVNGLDSRSRGGYRNHRSLPPVYNPGGKAYQSGIYCAFAMTLDDGEGFSSLKRHLDAYCFSVLSQPTDEDYKTLCSIVIGMYRRAYPDFQCADAAAEYMGRLVFKAVQKNALTGSRQMLKCIIELLDYARLCNKELAAYVHEMNDHIDNGFVNAFSSVDYVFDDDKEENEPPGYGGENEADFDDGLDIDLEDSDWA